MTFKYIFNTALNRKLFSIIYLLSWWNSIFFMIINLYIVIFWLYYTGYILVYFIEVNMIKKILLILLVLSMGKLYSEEIDIFSNHAFRLYGSVGAGYPFFNGGAGVSYAYEFGDLGKNKEIFFGISTDAQLGTSSFYSPPLVFNLQASLSVGKQFQNAGRFSYDILGSGFGIVYDFSESKLQSSWEDDNQFQYVLNFFSFHYTANNGFYVSWRNNLMLAFLEYRSYFTIGFDFSKIYNSKIYEKR